MCVSEDHLLHCSHLAALEDYTDCSVTTAGKSNARQRSAEKRLLRRRCEHEALKALQDAKRYFPSASYACNGGGIRQSDDGRRSR